MGQSLGVTLNPDPVDMDNPPTFDPLYGFPNGRQQRSKLS